MSSIPSPDQVIAMMDAAEPAPEAPAPEAPAVEAPTPEPAVEPVTPEAPAVEAPAADPDTFPRDYVHELRTESANYRTKLREFEAKFDGIDEADRDTFLYLMETYKSDPGKAVNEMAAIAKAYLEQVGSAEAPAASESAVPALGPEVMTVEKYQQMRQQELVEAQAGQIRRDAETLGYKTGSPEYQYLLSVAKAGDGDLNKAHAHIEAQHQARIDAAFAAKAQAAQNSPISPASGAGVPGTPAQAEIGGIKDAQAAAAAWLAAN